MGASPGDERTLRVDADATRTSTKLFAPSVAAAVVEGDLVFGSTGGATLRRTSAADGAARGEWTMRARTRAVPAEHLRAAREARVAELGEVPRTATLPNGMTVGPSAAALRLRQQAAANVEAYPTFPQFGALLAGSDGSLWVGDYPLPGQPTVRWYRLEDGVATAWVDVAAAARVLAFGSGLMVAVTEDEFGVATARVLRLDEGR